MTLRVPRTGSVTISETGKGAATNREITIIPITQKKSIIDVEN